MLTPKEVADLAETKKTYLSHNYELIDIFEGNLIEYVDKELQRQLSVQSYEQAKMRLAPINVLPKIIDKLTTIYNGSVIREVVDGSEDDKKMLAWYNEKMDTNTILNCANEMFNLCKTALIQPYIANKIPQLRVIQNDKFIVYSSNSMNRTVPTDIVLIDCYKGKKLYWHFTDVTVLPINEDGEVENSLLLPLENPNGLNPLGRLPFVYVNESHYRLVPKVDSDVLAMVKLLPVMLTDLNLASMFQSFSIMYGIDITEEGLKFAPNAFWRIKSDPNSDKQPSIGTIKPQVDFDQVTRLIQSQLSMWLSTKGIRASSVGELTTENFVSGISKIIDEMDTYEARQKQVGYFVKAEGELFDLVFNYMHPYWRSSKQIDSNMAWSTKAKVVSAFAMQLPAQSRGQVVKDVAEEYKAGFVSRKRAIQKLNPHLTAEEVDELIKEIDEEKKALAKQSSEGQTGGKLEPGKTPDEENTKEGEEPFN